MVGLCAVIRAGLRKRFSVHLAVLAAMLLAAAARPTLAATYTWNLTGGLGTWNVGSNWSSESLPDASNDALFNNSTSGTTYLNASGTSLGLTFGGAGAMTLLSASGTQTLAIGAQGITGNSGAGLMSLSTASGQKLNISLLASQTWTNNSATAFTVGVFNTSAVSPTVSPSVSGTTTLTLAGSGPINWNGMLANGNGTLAVDVTTSSTVTMDYGGGTYNFSGGLRLLAGQLTVKNAGIIGSNAITFAGNSTLYLNQSGANLTNAITINEGVTGTLGIAYSASQLSGQISGAGRAAFGIPGSNNPIRITGSNSFSGGALFNPSNGLVASVFINNNSALSTGTVTFAGASAFDSSLAGGVSLPNNPVLVNGNFFYGGTERIDFGTGAVTLNATPTITTGGTAALTFGGAIGGGFGITKAGTGTLVLGGANTFTGTTTLNNGTLRLTNQNSLQNSTLAVSGTGSLAFDSSVSGNAFTFGGLVSSNTAASLALQNSAASAIALTVGGNNASTTYAGGLTGPGTLTKTGTGTLTLSGSNSYAGTTRINAGTVWFSSTNALYGGASANWTADNLTTGAGGTVVLAAGTAAGSFTAANVGTILGMTSTGSTGFLDGSAIGIDTTGTTVTYSSSINNPNSGANSLGLVKLGTGTLALSGNNTYTGTTTIAAGTLEAGDAAALGSNGAIAFSGGVLRYTAASAGQDWSARFKGSSGAISLNPNGQTVTLANAIDSSNLGGLTLSGSGSTLVLGGNNTYAGTTTVSANTVLRVTHASGLGSAGDGTVVSSGGTLELSGNLALGNEAFTIAGTGTTSSGGAYGAIRTVSGTSSLDGPVTLSAAAAIALAANTRLTLNGAISLSSFGLTLGGNSAGDVIVNGTIAGTGGLSRQGTTTVSLLGLNTFTGAVDLGPAGSATVNSLANGGAASSLGAGSGANAVISFGNQTTGGVLTYLGTGHSTDRMIKIGNGTNSGHSGGATINANGSGTASFTGTFFNSPDSTATATSRSLTLGGTSAGAITGIIRNNGSTGTSAIALTKNDAGTWTLSGSNTYTGATQVNGGILVFSGTHAKASGTVTAAAAGTIGLGVGGANSFTSADVAALFGNTLTGFSMNAASGVAVDTTGGSFTISDPLAGSRGFTKLGPNTLTLSAINTYSGTTSITGGRLRVDSAGGLSNTARVVINGGDAELKWNSSSSLTKPITLTQGTLSGTGAIGAAVTAGSLAATFSPGNSPGIMPFGTAQTWNSFTYLWETNNFLGTTAGTDFDQITIAGSLALTGSTGSYLLDITSLTSGNIAGAVGSFSDTNRSWTILTTTGGISGFNVAHWTLSTADFTSSPAATGSWSISNVGNDLVLNYVVVVPEPAALTLAGLGVIVAGWAARRRRLTAGRR